VAWHVRVDDPPDLHWHAFPRRKRHELGRDASGDTTRVLAGRDPDRGTTDTRAGQRVPAGSSGPVWEDAEAGAQGAGCVLLRAQVQQRGTDCGK